MGEAIRFQIKHRCTRTNARVATCETAHGTFETPAFMTVGTRGTVKGLYPQQLVQAGCEVLLGNT